MTSEKFHVLFGGPPRKPESDVTQRDMDLDRSVQEVVEEIVLRMARHKSSIFEFPRKGKTSVSAFRRTKHAYRARVA